MNTIKDTQTVTISFFRYRGWHKIWGMQQMYGARAPMRKMTGLKFYKPLGSGSGVGYSLWPDWSVYGMLAVWENEQCAEDYLRSKLFSAYTAHSTEQYTVFLKPLSSRGAWSGFSGWEFSDPNPESQLMAALTRATLKRRFLFKFWSMVPGVSDEHKDAHGLIFTKGIGEIPLMEQATFSIWENKELMEAFAYQKFHLEAIQVTRQRNGFVEEMFTRLKPYRTVGKWKKSDPLAAYLQRKNEPIAVESDV